MNIKDIIDAERWGSLRPVFREHNTALDQIEEAVMKRIDKLEAELDRALAVNEEANKRIAKLEADKKWLFNFFTT